MEERGAGMGVAATAGADKDVLAANLSNELADKGFILTTADDLINWSCQRAGWGEPTDLNAEYPLVYRLLQRAQTDGDLSRHV